MHILFLAIKISQSFTATTGLAKNKYTCQPRKISHLGLSTFVLCYKKSERERSSCERVAVLAPSLEAPKLALTFALNPGGLVQSSMQLNAVASITLATQGVHSRFALLRLKGATRTVETSYNRRGGSMERHLVEEVLGVTTLPFHSQQGCLAKRIGREATACPY